MDANILLGLALGLLVAVVVHRHWRARYRQCEVRMKREQIYTLDITMNPLTQLWTFNDHAKGISQEPFLAAATCVITRWAKALGLEGDQLRLTFSRTPFDTATETFWWRQNRSKGADYYSPTQGRQFWLCPVLLAYFDSPPPTLWARLDPPEVE